MNCSRNFHVWGTCAVLFCVLSWASSWASQLVHQVLKLDLDACRGLPLIHHFKSHCRLQVATHDANHSLTKWTFPSGPKDAWIECSNIKRSGGRVSSELFVSMCMHFVGSVPLSLNRLF